VKKLPIWTELLKNFPNKEAKEVFAEIGGKVKLNYDIGVFKNACSTRISKALNYSLGGHEIPFFKTKDSDGNDVVQVSSGGKKLWYIYRVKALIEYLTLTYGTPKVVDVGKYKQMLKAKKGIIIFEVKGWSDASGHADLWDGSKVVGTDYGAKAHNILFWESF
jgi:hypothetical protein